MTACYRAARRGGTVFDWNLFLLLFFLSMRPFTFLCWPTALDQNCFSFCPNAATILLLNLNKHCVTTLKLNKLHSYIRLKC